MYFIFNEIFLNFIKILYILTNIFFLILGRCYIFSKKNLLKLKFKEDIIHIEKSFVKLKLNNISYIFKKVVLSFFKENLIP